CDGRIKPLESAALETMRQIAGRGKFEGKDPVAVLLSWLLLRGPAYGPHAIDWEDYPFILCDHRDLREVIYKHLITPERPLTEEERNGKYIAPADLRRSPDFKALIDEAEEIRNQDADKAMQLMNPLQRKAEEVAGRLHRYDTISQKNPLLG